MLSCILIICLSKHQKNSFNRVRERINYSFNFDRALDSNRFEKKKNMANFEDHDGKHDYLHRNIHIH